MTTYTVATRIATGPVALALSAVLAGCASSTSPTSSAPPTISSSTAPAAQAHNQADVTFATDMIPHQDHRDADHARQRGSLRSPLPHRSQPGLRNLLAARSVRWAPAFVYSTDAGGAVGLLPCGWLSIRQDSRVWSGSPLKRQVVRRRSPGRRATCRHLSPCAYQDW
jgi:hypothetical protein